MTLTWNTIAGRPASYAAVATHLGVRYSVIRKAKYDRAFVVWRDGTSLVTTPTLDEGKVFVEKLVASIGRRRAPAV